MFNDGWEKTNFNNLLDTSEGIRRGPFGSALKKEYFVSNSDYVVYEQQNAIYDRYNTRYNITKEKYEELYRFRIKEKDFIMSGAGTIGRISRVPKGLLPGVINQALIRLRINEKSVDSEYFLQWMRSEEMQARLTEANPASAMVNLVPMSEVKQWSITIPRLEEQQKIGNFFKHLDQMITLEQRKLEKTKALKSAYLAEMFPAKGERLPKIRFTGFKKDWQEKMLGELGNTFSGMSGKTKKDFGHGDAEFVTYMNVFKNEISDTLLTEKVVLDKRQTEVKYGDVLFTTSSETPHEVGMSSMWLDNRPNVYLNSFCFGLRPASEINKLYLAYLLRSNVVRNQIEILAQGISRYNISKGKVMEITIYIPDYEEQKEIGEFFKKLDDTISNQQQKLNKLKAMKQAYLEEMFV